MSTRAQSALVIVCVLSAIVFVGYQIWRLERVRSYGPDASFSRRAQLGEATSNGVRVTLFLESDARGQLLLRSTFTPIRAGLHVYSKDLDPSTTGDVGLATRPELLPHSSVRVAGALFADIAAQGHRVSELDAVIDTYPDGPVTLRLPIHLIGSPSDVRVQIAVSYMACQTDGVCLLPVEHEMFDVALFR